MKQRPPGSTRTATLFPYPALFRSDPGLDRIDAECRLHILAERQVRGGKTQQPAAGVAMLDPPLDLPRAAEQNAGLQRLSGAQMLADPRSEEHTSELQSLMRISYAVFCLKTKNMPKTPTTNTN